MKENKRKGRKEGRERKKRKKEGYECLSFPGLP
jgi:hypothetical protein